MHVPSSSLLKILIDVTHIKKYQQYTELDECFFVVNRFGTAEQHLVYREAFLVHTSVGVV